MPPPLHYLAIDLGASSGRAVLGTLDAGMLRLQEIHRFPNGPIELPSGLHWDADRLFTEVKQSITAAAALVPRLSGIGIDTWGVDYTLLDSAGLPLAQPHHYRDPRTRGLMDRVVASIPRAEIYARTGIQFLEFNTLYQLVADQREPGNPLARAAHLLFIPDYLNYLLTGIARTEPTIASTAQLFDPTTSAWDFGLIDRLKLPHAIFPDVVAPATTLGPLLPTLATATGAGPVPVIAVGSHDTASAVAAVPAQMDRADWAYVSSGTWSLVGRELAAPLRSPEALAANFTNEIGIENTIRFHKNVTGLWLLQECQRHWAAQGQPHDFTELAALAAAAPPHASLIDPDHPSFAEFGDMPARITSFCESTGQKPPASIAATARCVFESLALKCRLVIELLESLTSPVRTIHIVGGGCQNELLCQFIADATGRRVLAGPSEATAIGNLLTQALAQRALGSLAELRSVVARTLPPREYARRSAPAWEAAYARFHSILPT